jgi:hypothetical protein
MSNPADDDAAKLRQAIEATIVLDEKKILADLEKALAPVVERFQREVIQPLVDELNEAHRKLNEAHRDDWWREGKGPPGYES